MSSDSSSKKPNKRTAAVMDEDDPNIGLSILSSQSQNYPRAQSAVSDTFSQVASTGYGLHDTTSTSNVSNPPTQNLSSKTPWTVYPLRLPSFSAGTSVAGSNMPAGLSATSSPNAAALLSTSQSPEFVCSLKYYSSSMTLLCTLFSNNFIARTRNRTGLFFEQPT